MNRSSKINDKAQGVFAMKIKMGLIPSVFLFALFSCVGGGKYYRLIDDLKPEEIPKEAHYIYKDDDIVLAVRIMYSISHESFVYESLICNIGSEPIQLNLSFVNIFLTDDGKKYFCRKSSSARFYPDVLDPDSYRRVGFIVDSRFKHEINDIEELYFRLRYNETYTLTKNPDAKWE
jgi:hypothetical protein